MLYLQLPIPIRVPHSISTTRTYGSWLLCQLDLPVLCVWGDWSAWAGYTLTLVCCRWLWNLWRGLKWGPVWSTWPLTLLLLYPSSPSSSPPLQLSKVMQPFTCTLSTTSNSSCGYSAFFSVVIVGLSDFRETVHCQSPAAFPLWFVCSVCLAVARAGRGVLWTAWMWLLLLSLHVYIYICSHCVYLWAKCGGHFYGFSRQISVPAWLAEGALLWVAA